MILEHSCSTMSVVRACCTVEKADRPCKDNDSFSELNIDPCCSRPNIASDLGCISNPAGLTSSRECVIVDQHTVLPMCRQRVISVLCTGTYRSILLIEDNSRIFLNSSGNSIEHCFIRYETSPPAAHILSN